MSHGALNLVPDIEALPDGHAPALVHRRTPVRTGDRALLLWEAAALVVVLGGLLLVAVSASALSTGVVVATAAAWLLLRAARAGSATRWSVGPRALAECVGIIAALAAPATAWAGLGTPALGEVLTTATLLAVAAAGARWAALRHRGPLRVLLVGDADGVHRAARCWGTQAVTLTAVTGSGDPEEAVDLIDSATDGAVDLVVVAPGAGLDGAQLRRLGWALEDLGVSLVLLDDLEATARHRLRLVDVGGRQLLEVCSSRPRPVARLAKCLFDRVAGAVLLLIVCPLLLVLAVAVRLDSPGPAVFRQLRVGRYGTPFTMYKLRTMHVGAERVRTSLLDANESDAVLFKIRRDPRITRLGGLLRRYSLDELPQLVNVVRGEMSLVGPRPALPSEVAQYDELAQRRLVVRPGLTGLWQVSGRSDLDWDQSVALDVHYADNLTISGDLAICLRTVRAVLLAKGAY